MISRSEIIKNRHLLKTIQKNYLVYQYFNFGVLFLTIWVLGTAIALLTFGITIANDGGITQKVSQNLGLREGIVRIYNENAATNKVYA